MAMAFGCHVQSISIPSDMDGGKSFIAPPPADSELNRVRRILLAAAGAGAEAAFCEKPEGYLDGLIIGFVSDQATAEPDLTALGQDGAFQIYIAFASSILDRPEYAQAITSLAEDILKLESVSDQAKLNALASRIPQLEDLFLENTREVVRRALSLHINKSGANTPTAQPGS